MTAAPRRAGPGGDADPLAFLGEEFLIWLWWHAETRGGVHGDGAAGRIGIALDRLLEFHDPDTGVRVAVRGDAPTRAPEAREALRRGMHLLRAGLIVSLDEHNVGVVLDGRTLDWKSVKVEGFRGEGDTREERDEAALALLFGLVAALDRVYRAFLLERAGPRFLAEGAAELRAWSQAQPRVARPAGRGDAPVTEAAAG